MAAMRIELNLIVRKWSNRINEPYPYDVVMGASNGTYHSEETFASWEHAKKAIETISKHFPDSLRDYNFIKEGNCTEFENIQEANK